MFKVVFFIGTVFILNDSCLAKSVNIEDNEIETSDGGRHFYESPPSFSECFKKDSISCIQERLQYYGEYGLDQIFGKLSHNYPVAVRAFARSIQDSVPDSMKMSVAELSHGRGRGRRVWRALIPILVGLKVKFATIFGLVFLAVVFLAKKAFVFSAFSTMVTMFYMMKKTFTGDDDYKNENNGEMQMPSMQMPQMQMPQMQMPQMQMPQMQMPQMQMPSMSPMMPDQQPPSTMRSIYSMKKKKRSSKDESSSATTESTKSTR